MLVLPNLNLEQRFANYGPRAKFGLQGYSIQLAKTFHLTSKTFILSTIKKSFFHEKLVYLVECNIYIPNQLHL